MDSSQTKFKVLIRSRTPMSDEPTAYIDVSKWEVSVGDKEEYLVYKGQWVSIYSYIISPDIQIDNSLGSWFVWEAEGIPDKYPAKHPRDYKTIDIRKATREEFNELMKKKDYVHNKRD